RTDFPDLRVVIVGESDPEADARPTIRETAARYGIAARVDLVGPQPPDLLPQWYGAADLFCLPTSREGSANVLFEALASGLPCITMPVGGNPQFVATPALGILVAPEPGSLGAAIAAALSRAWDRRFISARGRARTWSAVAEECCYHLRRTASRNGSRRR